MERVLFFIYDDMADFEFVLTANFLGASDGKGVIPIAYEKNPVRSRAGLLYLPKATVMEALDFEDASGLIITGGWTRVIKPELTELIEKIYSSGNLIAAICAGPEILTRSTVLKKHKYTTTLVPEEYLRIGTTDPFPREKYTPEALVRDGNVITAFGTSFVDFAAEVADWYGLFDNDEEKARTARAYKGL